LSVSFAWSNTRRAFSTLFSALSDISTLLSPLAALDATRATPSLDAATNGRPSRFRRVSTRAPGRIDDSSVEDERVDRDGPCSASANARRRDARACAVARAPTRRLF
jgi:hypothetical protein